MTRSAFHCVAAAASCVACFAGELVWENGQADYRFEPDVKPYVRDLQLDRASHVPFRIFDGKELSLVPLFETSEPGFLKEPKSGPWVNFMFLQGQVIQSAAGSGALVRLKNSETVVFVRNLPRSADGVKITIFAKPDGLHEYTTVFGAVSTVHAFDFGKRVSASRERELFEVESARMKSERKMRDAEAKAKADANAAAIAKAREKAKRDRQQKIDDAVAKFRAEQAAKGNSSP